jgi:hypothetical protein
MDEELGAAYYYNRRTGATTWSKVLLTAPAYY